MTRHETQDQLYRVIEFKMVDKATGAIHLFKSPPYTVGDNAGRSFALSIMVCEIEAMRQNRDIEFVSMTTRLKGETKTKAD